MKTLATPHGTYLTGDALADATVDASVDLARRNEVGLVVLPFIDAGGAVARATFPIGWGCHIAARTARSGEDLIDLPALEEIRSTARTELQLRGCAFPYDEVALPVWLALDGESDAS